METKNPNVVLIVGAAVLIIFMFLVTSVHADVITGQPTIRVYGTEYVLGQTATGWLQLLDSAGTPINSASCRLTVYNPDANKTLSFNSSMTSKGTDGLYYLDFVPSTVGVMMASASCQIGSALVNSQTQTLLYGTILNGTLSNMNIRDGIVVNVRTNSTLISGGGFPLFPNATLETNVTVSNPTGHSIQWPLIHVSLNATQLNDTNCNPNSMSWTWTNASGQFVLNVTNQTGWVELFHNQSFGGNYTLRATDLPVGGGKASMYCGTSGTGRNGTLTYQDFTWSFTSNGNSVVGLNGVNPSGVTGSYAYNTTGFFGNFSFNHTSNTTDSIIGAIKPSTTNDLFTCRVNLWKPMSSTNTVLFSDAYDSFLYYVNPNGFGPYFQSNVTPLLVGSPSSNFVVGKWFSVGSLLVGTSNLTQVIDGNVNGTSIGTATISSVHAVGLGYYQAKMLNALFDECGFRANQPSYMNEDWLRIFQNLPSNASTYQLSGALGVYKQDFSVTSSWTLDGPLANPNVVVVQAAGYVNYSNANLTFYVWNYTTSSWINLNSDIWNHTTQLFSHSIVITASGSGLVNDTIRGSQMQVQLAGPYYGNQTEIAVDWLQVAPNQTGSTTTTLRGGGEMHVSSNSTLDILGLANFSGGSSNNTAILNAIYALGVNLTSVNASLTSYVTTVNQNVLNSNASLATQISSGFTNLLATLLGVNTSITTYVKQINATTYVTVNDSSFNASIGNLTQLVLDTKNNTVYFGNVTVADYQQDVVNARLLNAITVQVDNINTIILDIWKKVTDTWNKLNSGVTGWVLGK